MIPLAILDPNSLIYIPYPRVNYLKTIPFRAANTYTAHIWHAPPPSPLELRSPTVPAWLFSLEKRHLGTMRIFFFFFQQNFLNKPLKLFQPFH